MNRPTVPLPLRSRRFRCVCGTVGSSILLALSGCTTQLATQPVPGNVTAVAGIPYSLPALQYRATIKRTLADCGVKDGALKPDFDVSVEVAPAYVDGETFVADYRALASLTKTSSLKIETYDNHTIKAVNAIADDKGPEILAGVAKAGFSVARLALGLPTPTGVETAGGTRTQLTCPATVDQAKLVTKAIKDKTKELNDLNAELEPYVVSALIATLTDADKAAISELRTKIHAASKALVDLHDKLDEQEKTLSNTETVDLDFTAGALDRNLAFLSSDPAVKALQEAWIKKLFGGMPSAAELGDLSVVATLRPIGAGGADASICQSLGLNSCLAATPTWKRSGLRKSPTAIPGIAYRQPVRARLRVCRETTAAVCAGGGEKTIVEADAWAPQVGMLVVLPFSNGFGANNQLQAQFRADGSLDWASYDEKRAVALASVDAVNQALTGAVALSGDITAKRKAEASQAKADAAAAATANVTAAQNALAIAQAQSQLATIQAASDPSNQAIAREQALLDAEVARLTAEVQIKELEAKLKP